MARHLRHHHVKYHEVWLLVFDLSKRLRAGTGGAYRVTFVLQEITQDLYDVVRIIHDKNFGLLGHDFLAISSAQYTEPSRKVQEYKASKLSKHAASRNSWS